jgi:putative oxidoreductase
VLVRRLARPMLASMFIVGGIDTLRRPAPKVQAAEGLGLQENTETVVKGNAVAQVVAGLTLATNRLPRLSALVLAGSLVPTTAAGHRFWEYSDRTQRADQTQHFIKNVSMLGGLLLASVDTEGRESVARRTKRVSRSAARKAAKRSAKAAAVQRQHVERFRDAIPVG